MSIMDLKNLMNIAINASKEASNILVKNKNLDELDNSFNIKDVKLASDVNSEKILKKFIESKSKFPILGEELGKSHDDLGEIFWVLDPLDGTFNYSRNIPISCISIALVKNYEPILGVIYDFNNNDLYTGSITQKAMLNDKNINVSDIDKINQSVLLTGFPVKSDFSDQSLKNKIDDYQKYKKIRMIGSAAISCVYVASGRAEVYKEEDTNLWDIAAGVIIIRSAGGKADIKNLKDDFSLDIIASNKNLKI